MKRFADKSKFGHVLANTICKRGEKLWQSYQCLQCQQT